MKDMYGVFATARDVLGRFCDDDAGTTAIEYALIAAGLSIAIVTAVANVGDDVVALFTRVEGEM